ncbi:hypothetical protein TcCL_ESM12569 [Trypanosoma cruzi]|uniref:Uncharacterized protein n=1 Tax=Trypanosoma cruzi (strain CL Brener) TaxID=353153 RepID=Q4CQ41_TRYCC|nr:hypothetical protein, conserved [Trypanosoma cruzi]EAN82392.1 hypothetical protein, conserved [Trypanosoma cruzi]RNC50383.1 hypothetical protein TcCL_ESM12569 [Trypanosoma cruzi]|eukprot:XP_804243.1 hypothetical protein [Trypanosoma cruzi strain CL Brener]
MENNSGTDTGATAMNIAMASTIVYGLVLLAGSCFFFIRRGKGNFSLRGVGASVFFLSAFAVMPTVLALGIAGAWICTAYDSLGGAVAFLVVPGMILFFLLLAWCAAASRDLEEMGGALDFDRL